MDNNKKVDFSQRMESLRQDHEKNKMSEERQEIPADMFLCPFMSDSRAEIPCSPKCPMYRKTKPHAYACPFTELSNMAWNIKDKCDRDRRR